MVNKFQSLTRKCYTYILNYCCDLRIITAAAAVAVAGAGAGAGAGAAHGRS